MAAAQTLKLSNDGLCCHTALSISPPLSVSVCSHYRWTLNLSQQIYQIPIRKRLWKTMNPRGIHRQSTNQSPSATPKPRL
ncbi:hypothetical protein MSAN_01899200 [Mycena sanguinolenta]|uniref:Uncharacterized protein n=1 Tax=Mycena sanguinolenta TaxID=230812 RepID=A0A8H6XRF0_9AGAR|nr:hypothetical protein MSAN_01899200 [Mycena sanguinolenta]